MHEKTARKAEQLLALHHSGKMLVLPNIWDVAGAKLLETLGYPALATASAAVAYSQGYEDGEVIPFAELLHLVRRIAASTELPLSVDFERGYAPDLGTLASNIEQLIAAGAVGINLEDSPAGHTGLFPLEEQCERIRCVRRTAEQAGVPMVINARTDAFICGIPPAEALNEAIARGRAYLAAGADCFYPILCSIDVLRAIRQALPVPINVLLTADTLPMPELEAMGIARLSLGPRFFLSALTRMREAATALQRYDGAAIFTEHLLSSQEVVAMLHHNSNK